MRNNIFIMIITSLGLIAIIFLGLTNLLILKDPKLDSYTNILSGICTIISAIIAVLGVVWTIKFNNDFKQKELLDNLDSKSEWRKQLYDVASKTQLTTDDVFRILSSLRYLPKGKKEIRKSDQKDFDKATQKIFKNLYNIISNKYENSNGICDNPNEKCEYRSKVFFLSLQESEIVRLYTRYLLKHHWEFYNSSRKKLLQNEKRYFEDIQKYVDRLSSTNTDNNLFIKSLYELDIENSSSERKD